MTEGRKFVGEEDMEAHGHTEAIQAEGRGFRRLN